MLRSFENLRFRAHMQVPTRTCIKITNDLSGFASGLFSRRVTSKATRHLPLVNMYGFD